MTTKVLLDPANPHDFDAAELDELAALLRAEIPGADVEAVFRDEDGYGGPLLETLHVWVEAGGAASTALIALNCIRWMKARFDHDHEEHPPPERPRGRAVTIYEEETITRKITIDLPDGDAVDTPIDEDETPPHPRPEP
jgi:hypothetical protein